VRLTLGREQREVAAMHNHQKKFKTMIASGQFSPAAGTFTNVAVRHGVWCAIHTGDECNCDPDIEIPAAEQPDRALLSVASRRMLSK
jgi:hypothetical protein